MGLILGVVSVFTILSAATGLEQCLLVCPIPLVGMFIALRSWAQINKMSDMYTGSRLALAGFALSTFFLVTGIGYGSYVYATEVPEGYARITFGGLKPDKVESRGDKLIPVDIQELDGQKIFIKGYIRPDSLSVRKNAKEFLLVRDNNQCCFGDLSKINYFDQMQVAMQGSLSVDYSLGIFRMGGTLRMNPNNLAYGPDAPVFMLEADYAK